MEQHPGPLFAWHVLEEEEAARRERSAIWVANTRIRVETRRLEGLLARLAASVAVLDTCGFNDTAKEDRAERRILEDARDIVGALEALGIVERPR